MTTEPAETPEVWTDVPDDAPPYAAASPVVSVTEPAETPPCDSCGRGPTVFSPRHAAHFCYPCWEREGTTLPTLAPPVTEPAETADEVDEVDVGNAIRRGLSKRLDDPALRFLVAEDVHDELRAFTAAPVPAVPAEPALIPCCDHCGCSTPRLGHDDTCAKGCNDAAPAPLAETREAAALAEVRQRLGYIASPTMGLPPGRDAAEFAAEATEQNARLALRLCIENARLALAALSAPPAPTEGQR